MLKSEILPPYSPGDLAALFGVHGKTIRRWELDGKLPGSFKTPGGHTRWHREPIDALLAGSVDEVQP